MMYYPITNAAHSLFKSARPGVRVPPDGLTDTWVAIATMNLGLALSVPASEGVDPPAPTREMAFRERGLHRALARNVHPARLPPYCHLAACSVGIHSRGRWQIGPRIEIY